MKTYKTPSGREVTIHWASALSAGHGHKKITVDVRSATTGEYIHKEFKGTTSNMSGYDDASDLEGQENYDALFELVQTQIEDQIDDWLESELY